MSQYVNDKVIYWAGCQTLGRQALGKFRSKRWSDWQACQSFSTSTTSSLKQCLICYNINGRLPAWNHPREERRVYFLVGKKRLTHLTAFQRWHSRKQFLEVSCIHSHWGHSLVMIWTHLLVWEKKRAGRWWRNQYLLVKASRGDLEGLYIWVWSYKDSFFGKPWNMACADFWLQTSENLFRMIGVTVRICT